MRSMNRCQPCPQPGEVLREDGLLIGYVETDDLASAPKECVQRNSWSLERGCRSCDC